MSLQARRSHDYVLARQTGEIPHPGNIRLTPSLLPGIGIYRPPEADSRETSPEMSDNEDNSLQSSETWSGRSSCDEDPFSLNPAVTWRTQPTSSDESCSSGVDFPVSSTKPTENYVLPAATAGTSDHVEKIMLQINICVLGASEVGKTCFVQNALDIRKPSIGLANTKRMSLNGVVYAVRLLEVAFADLNIEDDGSISWPNAVDEHAMPRVDGAFVLYSVMDSASLGPVAKTLSALQKNAIPCLLVSCKCDNHPALREIDPALVEWKAKSLIEGIDVLHTVGTAPDTYKRCMSNILRAIVSLTQEQSNPVPHQARAASSAVSHVARREIEQNRPRATSEFSATMVKSSANHSRDGDAESQGSGARTPTASTLLDYSTVVHNAPLQYPAAGGRGVNHEPNWKVTVSGTRADESIMVNRAARDSMMGVQGSHSRTFLDLDESASAESTDETDSHESEDEVAQDVEKSVQPKLATEPDGVTLEALVDRLLAQPITKADEKFVDIFLALYRKFAAPSELLHDILDRFEALNRATAPQMVRITSQLRCLVILDRWSSSYPGDFAHPLTKAEVRHFIGSLSAARILAVAAKELTANLSVDIDDCDTDWGYNDLEKDPGRRITQRTFLTYSSADTAVTARCSDCEQYGPSGQELDGLTLDDNQDLSRHLRHLGSHPASATALRVSRSSPALTVLRAKDSSQRVAQALTPNPRYHFSKAQWHQLMDIPEEAIARQLTRIDWLMFVSIRPRDLIRHVSLASTQRRKPKSGGKNRAVENVTRMADHFNHLAYWVANLILLREKPKHRALALEKLMRVARKVRELNNYNALGALVAGINSTPIHRLSATRDLVPADTAKDFMKLEILMSTQKSHFAYRLAWENSSTERIPFLPLHRRDLVSVEQGSKTFVGDEDAGAGGKLINWRKFEIMGEAVVGVMRAQDVPGRYKHFVAQEEIRALVLNGRLIKDDDVLYDRSLHIEPAGAGSGDGNFFKKWFQ